MSNDKGQISSILDPNNNEMIISNETTHPKKQKSILSPDNGWNKRLHTVGQIKELHMLNFMCHKNFSIPFYPTPMHIVTGANGSGK
jgi:hypothetical protein